MAHRTLDEIAFANDHARPVHPLRDLWQNRFYTDGLISTEGGLWILLMDALLFVPLTLELLYLLLQDRTR